jgi:hypothetical protein
MPATRDPSHEPDPAVAGMLVLAFIAGGLRESMPSSLT